MSYLILPKERLGELQALNSTNVDRKYIFCETIDGTLLVSNGGLNDLYWVDYQEFLNSLSPFNGDPIFKEDMGVL